MPSTRTYDALLTSARATLLNSLMAGTPFGSIVHQIAQSAAEFGSHEANLALSERTAPLMTTTFEDFNEMVAYAQEQALNSLFDGTKMELVVGNIVRGGAAFGETTALAKLPKDILTRKSIIDRVHAEAQRGEISAETITWVQSKLNTIKDGETLVATVRSLVEMNVPMTVKTNLIRAIGSNLDRVFDTIIA